MSQYTLTENYDLNKVKYLLENPDIIQTDKKYDKFLRELLHHNGNLKVNYNYSKNKDHASGRLYADQGIQMVSSQIRNFLLCDQDLVDIDIQNSGPTIILNICKSQKLKPKYYKTLEEFVLNRQEIIKTHYQNDKEKCKNFIRKSLFNSNKVKCKTAFEINLDQCFKIISKKLSKCEEFSDLLQEAHENGGDNILGSFLNRVYTLHEDQIIRHAIEKYKHDTKKQIRTIMFDGFIAEKISNYDLNHLNQSIQAEFQMSVEFCYKPIISPIPYENQNSLLIDYTLIKDGRAFDVAEFIKEEVKKLLVLCNEIWYKYDDQKCVWTTTKAPARIIISTLKKYIDETVKIYTKNLKKTTNEDEKELLRKQLSQITSCYTKINNNAFYSMLEKFLRDYVCDNDFILKLNKNLYQIAFQNGMFDLKTLTFRQGLRQDDYVSNPISFDYKESSIDEQTEIHNIIQKICNNDEEHKDYYLSVFGYALTGDAEREKALWYLVGQGGNNGKTLILDSLATIAPSYVATMDAKAFDEKCNNRHKYLSSFNGGKRIIYMEELPKKGSIDAKTMKQVADGKQLNNEKLYGTTETIDVTAKVFTLSNHTPKFDNDAGTENRFRQIQLNSEFNTSFQQDDFENLKFVADKNLANTLKTRLANALLDVLFQYAHSYYKNQYNLKTMPALWLEKTKETIHENSAFKTFFEDFMDTGEDYRLDKSDIEYIAKELKSTTTSIKDDINKLNFKYDKAKRGRNGIRGVYIGIRLKPLCELTDDESCDNQSYESK